MGAGAIAAAGGGRRSRRAQAGLDAEVIETFPAFVYSSVKGLKIGNGSLECAVCLNEFGDDETLRFIPNCSHVFHSECIDAWLSSHTTCPVCRANLQPKPGELPYPPVQLFEQDQNSVEPDNGDVHNHVAVHVINDDDDRSGEVTHVQPPDVNLLDPTVQSRPPRSWSTGWRFSALFPRSHSTGHSLIQRGENLDRFTLRLPEDVRSQLLNTKLNRTKSCVAFTRVRSSRRGFRSRSAGTGRGRSYERFDREGRPDRWGLTVTPSFISGSGSIKWTKGVGVRSVKSLFNRTDKDDNNNSSSSNDVGERSFDRLRPDGSQV